MSLNSIRLSLARDPDFPQGSRAHGYEFIAPLGADSHLDVEAWRKHRKDCRVRRFWAGTDDELGHLVHTRGRSWAFHYDLVGNEDEDEPGFRFDSHRFEPGEYVSIREQDGVTRTFRIDWVKPIAILPKTH